LRNEGASASAMPYGWSDEFEDQTGVDAGNSVNESYTNAGYYYDGIGSHPYALQFDGTDDKVTVPPSATLTFSTAWTISGWLKFLPTCENCYWFTKWTGSDGPLFHVGYAAVCIQNGSGNWGVDTSMPTNVWHHFLWTHDGAASPKNIVWTNGAVCFTDDNFGDLSTNADTVIIGDLAGGGGARPIVIDQVDCWDRAIEGAGVTQLYNSGMARIGNVSVWPYNTNWVMGLAINEGGGTALADGSGSSNTGAVNGATWVTNSVAMPASTLTNMILVSQPFASTYPFTAMRLSAKVYDVMGGGIVGTNTPGRVSANNGTNYYTVPWTETNSLGGNYWMLSGMVAVTSTPTTVSNRWRLDMTNNVEYQYHAVDVRGNW
jgi:hypothetical protein